MAKPKHKVSYESMALVAKAPSHTRGGQQNCYVLETKQLSISSVNNPSQWRFTSDPRSRFSQVAELLEVRSFKISGSVDTKDLQPDTEYSVFLVFKLGNSSCGLKKVSTLISFSKQDTTEEEFRSVCLDTQTASASASDGWVEVELGRFFNIHRDDDKVQVVVKKRNYLKKMSGLLVGGIEFRSTQQ